MDGSVERTKKRRWHHNAVDTIESKSCVCLAAASIDCALWELSRKDRQAKAMEAGEDVKKKEKTHIFFTLPAPALSGRHA
jgi:hypothetical protein